MSPGARSVTADSPYEEDLAIYADAQTSLKEPRHLEQLMKSLDSIDWFSAKQDGLGDLYEGLLEKNAKRRCGAAQLGHNG